MAIVALENVELEAGLKQLRANEFSGDGLRTIDEASRYIAFLEGKQALLTKIEEFLGAAEEKGEKTADLTQVAAIWAAHNKERGNAPA